MENQNYANHRKLFNGKYYGLYFTLLSLAFFGSIGNLICVSFYIKGDVGSALLLVLSSLIGLAGYFYSRSITLKVQDRVIRTEENFRYYILTGKQLPSGLKLSQIIGLRFASDEEFVALVETSLKEKLSMNEIKKQIKNWRADYQRA